jgi:hypothetical protein
LSRIRFLFAIAALTVAASALAACGGGGGSSDASPQSVLDGATLEGVESADLNAKIDVSATGDKGGDIEVTLAGPFESVEGGSTPKLDLTAEASGSMNGKDVEFEGGLVLLPNSAYVGYEGTEYEVDPTTYGFIESALKQAQRQGAQESEAGGTSACRKVVAGLKVGDFVDNLTNAGEADVGGTTTTKVSGDLDVGGAIDEMLKLYSDPACSSQLSAAGELPSASKLRAAKDEVTRAVKAAHVDVYVGDDDIIRRITGEVKIEPKGSGSGPSSATVAFDISLEGVNEDQEIEAPAKTKPLNDLFLKLGVNPLELLGALQGGGPGGLGNLLEGMHAESPNGL